MKQILNFINGEYTAGTRQFDKRSPLNNSVIAQVPRPGGRRSTRRSRPRVQPSKADGASMTIADRVDMLYARGR